MDITAHRAQLQPRRLAVALHAHVTAHRLELRIGARELGGDVAARRTDTLHAEHTAGHHIRAHRGDVQLTFLRDLHLHACLAAVTRARDQLDRRAAAFAAYLDLLRSRVELGVHPHLGAVPAAHLDAAADLGDVPAAARL